MVEEKIAACRVANKLPGKAGHQFTNDELIGVLAANNLSYPDEELANGFKYSDTGCTILAKIIQRVSGMPYDRFVLENLSASRPV